MVVGGSWGATWRWPMRRPIPSARHRHRVARDFPRHQGRTGRCVPRRAAAHLSGALQGFSRRAAVLADGTRATDRGLLPPHPRSRSRHARARCAGLGRETERILSEVSPSRDRLDLRRAQSLAHRCPATPFMEAHYFQNDCFMAPDQLINEAGRLAGIPGIIVQGRLRSAVPAGDLAFAELALAGDGPARPSTLRLVERRRPFAVRSRS